MHIKVRTYYVTKSIYVSLPSNIVWLPTHIVDGIITRNFDSYEVHRYMPSIRGEFEITRINKLSTFEFSLISRAASCIFSGGPTILFIDVYFNPYLKIYWIGGGNVFNFGYIEKDQEYWWKCNIDDVEYYIEQLKN